MSRSRRPIGLPRCLGNDTEATFGPMEDDCLLYKWGRNKDGYGVIRDNYKWIYAHRWYYEMAVGVLRRGQVVNHLCEQRACCNPGHLEACYQKDNNAWTKRRRG